MFHYIMNGIKKPLCGSETMFDVLGGLDLDDATKQEKSRNKPCRREVD